MKTRIKRNNTKLLRKSGVIALIISLVCINIVTLVLYVENKKEDKVNIFYFNDYYKNTTIKYNNNTYIRKITNERTSSKKIYSITLVNDESIILYLFKELQYSSGDIKGYKLRVWTNDNGKTLSYRYLDAKIWDSGSISSMLYNDPSTRSISLTSDEELKTFIFAYV